MSERSFLASSQTVAHHGVGLEFAVVDVATIEADTPGLAPQSGIEQEQLLEASLPTNQPLESVRIAPVERHVGKTAIALLALVATAVVTAGCRPGQSSESTGNTSGITVSTVADNLRCNSKPLPALGGKEKDSSPVHLTYHESTGTYAGDPEAKKVSEKVLGSLVQISTDTSLESGFLVRSPDGKSVYAITAAHGIADKVTVTDAKGKSIETGDVCFVLQTGTTSQNPGSLPKDATTPRYDIAIIKIPLDKHGKSVIGTHTLSISDDNEPNGKWVTFVNYQNVQATSDTNRIAGKDAPAIYNGIIYAQDDSKWGYSALTGLDKRSGIYGDRLLDDGGSGGLVLEGNTDLVTAMSYASGQDGNSLNPKDINVSGVETTLTAKCATNLASATTLRLVLQQAQKAFAARQ